MIKTKGLNQADIDEFGFDGPDDTANVPRLIAALREEDREAFRHKLRLHVCQMTGRSDVTWRQYMDKSY